MPTLILNKIILLHEFTALRCSTCGIVRDAEYDLVFR
jgi:hypothetical protein